MPLLVLLLIAVPIAELYVIVQVAQGIGVLQTIALLVLVSIAGAWLLKQQGIATWRRLQDTLARGEMPTAEVTDGALILFGGALLLTPGFLTDVVGLLLLLPPTRAAIKGTAARFIRWMAFQRFGLAGEAGRRIYEARVTRRRPTASEPPPRRLPSSERPDDEDGSRDTG